MATVEEDYEALTALKRTSASAQAGEFFPRAEDVVSGCAVYSGETYGDVSKWREVLLGRVDVDGANGAVAALLERYLLTRDPVDLRGLHLRVMEAMPAGLDEILRAAVHASAAGDRSKEVWTFLESACSSGFAWFWFNAWRDPYLVRAGPRSMTADAQLDRVYRGASSSFRQTADRAVKHAALLLGVEERLWAIEKHEFGNFLAAIGWKPEAGSADVAAEETAVAAAEGAVTVVAKPNGKMSPEEKRAWNTMEGIASIPLVPRRFRDPGVVERLYREWPHAADVVAALLSDLVLDAPVRFRPTLLVGKPGTGKTALLQAVVAALDVPSVVYPCSGSSDNSFGGTASRWTSACASTPLELVRQSQVPNGVVILDELEKGPRDTRYGSVADTLLPLLERHTARVFYEIGLNTTSDLSHVSYLATANSRDLPAPILDRFRILEMPIPKVEHLPALCRNVVSAIAAERGLAGLLPPLAPDELEVVARTWRAGSLRRLRRAVETAIDVRERLAVRQ
ncbi:AAA family ATPase [Aureimonas jatrophae]|uniref:ATPase family associated with various cellular activities (AAA) n=1 Tax=Aureimonas jatrophae TaxID=1166073 RepID=A0A1H0M669_9HYPH|nr:AAA family ATPase [Aureimonas jatrophae]MBB3952617.1 hypothetical protein [Aureimonas jatrophae]SDO75620.1 ATPase family associated with various cellular activities (AAA) [Aureimonas jatrophae]